MAKGTPVVKQTFQTFLLNAVFLFMNAACLVTAQAAEPGEVFKDCPVCPEMVVIPAGEFVMGSDKTESGHLDEKPQHKVKISKPQAVAKFETSFALWDACTAEGICPKAVTKPHLKTARSEPCKANAKNVWCAVAAGWTAP